MDRYEAVLTVDGATAVADLHHVLPLNYNLFSPRKLVASSYVAVLPLHVVNLAVLGVAASLGGSSPVFLVYTLAVLVLGISVGLVHNASHRRKHGLPVHTAVAMLQDLGVLLHPDVYVNCYCVIVINTCALPFPLLFTRRQSAVVGCSDYCACGCFGCAPPSSLREFHRSSQKGKKNIDNHTD